MSAGQQKKKGKAPSGVRGPGGPPPPGTSGKPRGYRATVSTPGASERRQAFERLSFPLLSRIAAVPRWLFVTVPAALLFLGLIQTGSLAWLGGVFLLAVFAILTWLTALSWPAITPGSRLIRVIVLLALFGIAVLKFMGRF